MTTATKPAKSKRVREVFPRRMVAHIWAQRTQAYGRNSGHTLFFDGDSIYSYGRHFEIAKFVTNKRGQMAVFFTTRDHSVTTAAHKSMVQSALAGSQTVFHVKYCGFENTADNLTDFVERILDTVKRAMRARSNRDWLMRQAAALVTEANQYSQFVGSRKRFALPDEAGIKRAAELAKQRERAALRKQEAGLAKREAQAIDNIDAWKRGIFGAAVPCTVRKVYLRLIDSDMGREIETSKGAIVPLKVAQAVLPLVRAGRAVEPELCQRIHLGHFRLDSVEANGTIRAGCHTIERDEIERIAAQLGL